MTQTSPIPLAIVPMPSLGQAFTDSYKVLADQMTQPTELFSRVCSGLVLLHDSGFIGDECLSGVTDSAAGITNAVDVLDKALERYNGAAASKARSLISALGFDASAFASDYLHATVDFSNDETLEISALIGLHCGNIEAFCRSADRESALLAKAMLQCLVADSDLLIDQAEYLACSHYEIAGDRFECEMGERCLALYEHYEETGWPSRNDAREAMIAEAMADESDLETLEAILTDKYDLEDAIAAIWPKETLAKKTPSWLKTIATSAAQDQPRVARLKHLARCVAGVVENTPLANLGCDRSDNLAPVLIGSSEGTWGMLYEHGDMIQQTGEYPSLMLSRLANESGSAFLDRAQRVLVAAHARALILELMSEHGLFDSVDDLEGAFDAATEHGTDTDRLAA